ncbi:MAG TPA: hypothetical protein VHK27_07060 [Gammaproteobacteria bacterium]|nr:hypothetical protein [Gammaproteobacteria bacterium]
MSKTRKLHRATVRVYLSRRDGWRWRIRINGRIIYASSEAYKSRSMAIRNLAVITGIAFEWPTYIRGNLAWLFNLNKRVVEFVGAT